MTEFFFKPKMIQNIYNFLYKLLPALYCNKGDYLCLLSMYLNPKPHEQLAAQGLTILLLMLFIVIIIWIYTYVVLLYPF